MRSQHVRLMAQQILTSSALRGLRLAGKKTNRKTKEIIVPTTDLFEAYIENMGSRPADFKYSLATYKNQNMHYLIENATPKQIINEIVLQFLTTEDDILPFYYLRSDTAGIMGHIISHQIYEELKDKKGTEKVTYVYN